MICAADDETVPLVVRRLEQIRMARNEAGHPKSIDAVTPETVHASLLIFPELAKLCHELRSWISKSYS